MRTERQDPGSIVSPRINRLVLVVGSLLLTFAAVPPAGAGHDEAPTAYLASSNGKIQRVDMDGAVLEDLVTTDAAVGIALDQDGGKVYWTNRTTSKIQRSNIDGTGAEDLVTGLSPPPVGIALDVADGKVYWLLAALGSGKIQRANLDGTGVTDVLGGLGDPRHLTIDATGGKMYWTDAGTDSVRRANLDGSSQEVLVSGQIGPFGIALDLAGGKMYWTDSSVNTIRRANLDGSSVETLITAGTGPSGIALDLIAGKMYWVNLTTGDLRRASLDGTGVEIVVSGLGGPHGIVLTEDATPPAITLTTPTDGATYTLGQIVAADYECDDEGGSGLATCVGDLADGVLLDTTSVGLKTFTVDATDNAGNVASLTHDYIVAYDFAGFFSPVDNLPTLNLAKAGSAIPIKFSLGGDQGLDIFATGYPKSQPIVCDNSASVDGIEETMTAGSSSLAYDPVADLYTYVWKTLKGWAGTCRQLVLKLDDESFHRANFQFK